MRIISIIQERDVVILRPGNTIYQLGDFLFLFSFKMWPIYTGLPRIHVCLHHCGLHERVYVMKNSYVPVLLNLAGMAACASYHYAVIQSYCYCPLRSLNDMRFNFTLVIASVFCRQCRSPIKPLPSSLFTVQCILSDAIYESTRHKKCT